MIIPIRCFTCGNIVADKYDWYVKEVQKLQKKEDEKADSGKLPTKKQAQDNYDMRHFDALRTGPILDKLGLDRYCCRRMILGTEDLMETI